MDIRYRITGGVPLQGDVTISGSKNAALPMLAGTVLAAGPCVIENVPKLRDTELLLSLLSDLGAKVAWEGAAVHIDTMNMESKPLTESVVCKLRGSIVLLGPLLARFGVVETAYPGGCVLGKRPVDAHILAFTQMGVRDMSTDALLHLQGQLQPGRIILPEFSVTATENAIWAAAGTPGETTIELAAAEPHVTACAQMARAMGAEVEGIGTHTLTIRGRRDLHPVSARVPSDYLEAGCMIVAALVTKGRVRLHDVEEPHLTSFLDLLQRSGAILKIDAPSKTILVDGELSILRAMSVRTNIFPGFPTDLQAPVGVAMTQAKGVSRLFERLYEGRLAYLYELEKMGAHVEILNAHQALVIGPAPLKGRTVASNDIRAGAAMVIAALAAEGETTITDVRYIERGYEELPQKLRTLGAVIERTVIGEVPLA